MFLVKKTFYFSFVFFLFIFSLPILASVLFISKTHIPNNITTLKNNHTSLFSGKTGAYNLLNSQLALLEEPFGAYFFYRWVNSGEANRRCRFHPSCSYFTLQAIKKRGYIWGFLTGLARAQMEHSHQNNFLQQRSIAEDGSFIYFDPLENWNTYSKNFSHE